MYRDNVCEKNSRINKRKVGVAAEVSESNAKKVVYRFIGVLVQSVCVCVRVSVCECICVCIRDRWSVYVYTFRSFQSTYLSSSCAHESNRNGNYHYYTSTYYFFFFSSNNQCVYIVPGYSMNNIHFSNKCTRIWDPWVLCSFSFFLPQICCLKYANRCVVQYFRFSVYFRARFLKTSE